MAEPKLTEVQMRKVAALEAALNEFYSVGVDALAQQHPVVVERFHELEQEFPSLALMAADYNEGKIDDEATVDFDTHEFALFELLHALHRFMEAKTVGEYARLERVLRITTFPTA